MRIDESSKLIGKIRLGKDVYIAQGSVIRSHDDSVKIGNSSWVLENSAIIGTKNNPVEVGSKTIFGHKTVTIGAKIGDLCEIGNNTIFLPGSVIGDRCIFGEGTIVPLGIQIPSDSVVLGRPARILRSLTEEDKSMIARMRGNDISLDEFIEIVYEEDKGESCMDNLYEFNGKIPQVGKTSFVDDRAEITGDVVIGENCYIASGVRIIGNSHGPIRIGDNVDILENSVLHLLPDNDLVIQNGVSIGPNSMIHGTSIGRDSVIEAGTIICDYSKLGENCLVKAGSLVKQREVFESNSIIDGFPGKVVGQNTVKLLKPDWIGRRN